MSEKEEEDASRSISRARFTGTTVLLYCMHSHSEQNMFVAICQTGIGLSGLDSNGCFEHLTLCCVGETRAQPGVPGTQGTRSCWIAGEPGSKRADMIYTLFIS